MDPWNCRIKCDTCFSSKLFSNFRFFRCGHGLCTGCTASLKRAPNPTCPHCRVKISKTDGNKLFIDFLDPTDPDSDDIIPSGGLSEGITKQARHAKRCIDGLDSGSSVKSARAVEKNLEQLGRALEDEEGPIAELLEAIKSFKERVLPVFTTIQDNNKQINDLLQEQTRLCDIRDKYKTLSESRKARIDTLEKSGMEEVNKLRADLTRQNRYNEKVLKSAESATKKVLELRQTNEILCQERETFKLRNVDKEKAKDEEINKLKAHCMEYKNKESSFSRKLKGLQQEKKELEQQLESLRHRDDVIEESLVVESFRVDAHDDVDLEDDDLDNQPRGMTMEHDEWDGHSRKSIRAPPARLQNTAKISRIPLNREPLADLPSAHIMEDDFEDDFIAQAKPFRSDWTLPDSKKRKAPPEDRPTVQPKFPLKMDTKGRLQGTVQLGSRKKMMR